MTTTSKPGREWRIVSAIAAGFVAVLWAAGATSPWVLPDTRGYVDVAPYPDFFLGPRLPFYGWLVAALAAIGLGHGAVVGCQVAVHVAAAIALHAGARAIGAAPGGAAALFVAALVSQSFVIYGRGIVPETLAASAALIAVAATLRSAAGARGLRFALLAGLAAAAAALLRPVFLPLAAILPLLHVGAARIMTRPVRAGGAALIAAAMAAPLVLWVAERARHTGDVNLVAFGGFQMSAMAGLMLTPEIVARFPAAERALAAEILAARTRAEDEGRVVRTPLNSRGERSFVSAAAGYFDIYVRTHDDLLYGAIARLRAPDESWIAFDRRLQRFTLATIRLAPAAYAAWVAGATARLAGRMLAANAPVALAGAAWLLLLAATMWTPAVYRRLAPAPDTLLVTLVVIAYTVAAGAMAVFVVVPAWRYIDTAAILLPALPLYGALRLAGALGRRERPL